MSDLDKPALRREMLARRAQISEATAGQCAKAIAGLLPSMIPPHSLVGATLPMHGELDLRPTLQRLHEKGVRLSLPKVLSSREMIFLPWQPGDALETDRYGALSPVAGTPLMPKLLLVPMLAFDCDHFRLGYGGGYYDRVIASHTPKTIGIAYHCQYLDKVPREPHDRPLDLMLTEQGVL